MNNVLVATLFLLLLSSLAAAYNPDDPNDPVMFARRLNAAKRTAPDKHRPNGSIRGLENKRNVPNKHRSPPTRGLKNKRGSPSKARDPNGNRRDLNTFVPDSATPVSTWDDFITDPPVCEGDDCTCKGYCGEVAPGGCFCDPPYCLMAGDCCEDVCEECDCETPPGTCEGQCGEFDVGGCFCDPDCQSFGDCCEDKCEECGCDPTDPPCVGDDCTSCKGQCGEAAPGGCYCDEYCLVAGDCCEDMCEECGCEPTDPPCVGDDCTSCKGHCGEAAPDGCYCDPICQNMGDCCEDACEECGHCQPVDTFFPSSFVEPTAPTDP